MLQLKNTYYQKTDFLEFIELKWLSDEFINWFVQKNIETIKDDLKQDMKHTKDHSKYMREYYFRITKPKRLKKKLWNA